MFFLQLSIRGNQFRHSNRFTQSGDILAKRRGIFSRSVISQTHIYFRFDKKIKKRNSSSYGSVNSREFLMINSTAFKHEYICNTNNTLHSPEFKKHQYIFSQSLIISRTHIHMNFYIANVQHRFFIYIVQNSFHKNVEQKRPC